MNRRKFCLSSVAAAIAAVGIDSVRAAAGPTTPGTPAASGPGVPLYKFIYDRRYSAGRAFGAAAEHAHCTAGTVAINADITALWARDLQPRWSAGGGAIAGMTTARTLFCLEQLAKDHWMRVVIRAEHALAVGHDVRHRLTAPEPMIVRLRSVLADEDWATHMPAALVTCRGMEDVPRTTYVGGSACGRRLAMTDEKLVSFVIA